MKHEAQCFITTLTAMHELVILSVSLVLQYISSQFNPLSPNSGQSLLSPYVITILANIQVMRIKEMTIKHEMSSNLTKFSKLTVVLYETRELRPVISIWETVHLPLP